MKKIITPATKEEARFFCDVSGKEHPTVSLKLSGGYGSDFDGESYSFDLSTEASTLLVQLLKLVFPGSWQQYLEAEHSLETDSHGVDSIGNQSFHEVVSAQNLELIIAKLQKLQNERSNSSGT